MTSDAKRESSLDILQDIRSLAGERFGIQPERIQFGALLRDVGIDSFMLIELVFHAEERFGIEIPLDGTAVTTVGEMIELVKTHLAGNKSAA
jgi:acyl carrier protein